MSRPLKARLGWAGYAHLLCRIHEKPGTIKAIAAHADIGRDTAYRLIPDLHACKLVHISGWSMPPRRPTLAIYSYGPGEDVPPPTTRPGGRPVTAANVLRSDRISPEVLAFSVFMRAIAAPATLPEIVAECGCHRDTAKSALHPLMAAGLVHIDHWQPREKSGGKWMANYILGPGANALRPRRERMRKVTALRWRDRVKRREPFAPLLAVFQPMPLAA